VLVGHICTAALHELLQELLPACSCLRDGCTGLHRFQVRSTLLSCRQTNLTCSTAFALLQDGSVDNLSDHDSYVEDMMLQGEPSHADVGAELAAEHGGAGAGAAPAELEGKPAAAQPQPLALLPPLVAGPAAAVAAAAHGAYCAASQTLHALAASMHAYLVGHIMPAGADVARRVVRGMAEIVESLRVGWWPLGWMFKLCFTWAHTWGLGAVWCYNLPWLLLPRIAWLADTYLPRC
jgi:hypothetical protein